MNNECQKYKDIIADFVSGLLEESQIENLQNHLNECKECNEYANELKNEDTILTNFFTQVDSDMQSREQKVLDAINTPEQKETNPRIIFRPLIKLAVAAAIIIIILFGLNKFDNSSIAWADVVEKFQSVEFFSAVFYDKDDALAQPEQIELWMGQTGNARVRIGSQVIFGKNGKVTEAFDITTRKKVEFDSRAQVMLEKISSTNGQFSLDTILNVIAKGSLTDVTPLVNSDAVISEDLVVFDIQLYETQWMRIWALRESKLPVHIRIWNSSDGSCLDAFMNYSKKQSDEFFDPKEFEDVLSQGDERNKTNIAYALLSDPGGKDITPKDIFNKSGYHVPVVKHAGITKEGAFWVIAEKGLNRMPNGHEIYGFSKIEDDLGRTYINMNSGRNYDGQNSFDLFIPIDFPFDKRVPSRITLTCDTSAYNINNFDLIGTVDLTDWQQDAPCPNKVEYLNPLNLKMAFARQLFKDEYADKLKRLIETIPYWSEQPEDASLLIFWSQYSYRQKDYNEVINIGQKLLTIMLKNPRQFGKYSIHDYLLSLAITGKIDEAAELFQQIDGIDDISPKKSDTKFYEQFLTSTAGQLAMSAHLELEQINKIMGFDITKRKGYENAVRNAKSNVTMNKLKADSEKLRGEIAEYYQSHPLPDKMDLLIRPDNENVYIGYVSNTVPGHEEYIIQPINAKISDFVSTMRVFGDIQPYEITYFRVEDESAVQQLHADLIYKEGTHKQEQMEFVLNQFGMELDIEEGPSRKVLVAKYNGQPLKNFKYVTAPIQHDGGKNALKTGVMSSSASRGFTLVELFDDLARQQNKDVEKDEDKLVLFNETGISFEDGSVSSETAFWPGTEGLEQAKKWFEEQFGVTFTEETRQMKTYVIRKKSE